MIEQCVALDCLTAKPTWMGDLPKFGCHYAIRGSANFLPAEGNAFLGLGRGAQFESPLIAFRWKPTTQMIFGNSDPNPSIRILTSVWLAFPHDRESNSASRDQPTRGRSYRQFPVHAEREDLHPLLTSPSSARAPSGIR